MVTEVVSNETHRAKGSCASKEDFGWIEWPRSGSTGLTKSRGHSF